jgi:hypothetical protein
MTPPSQYFIIVYRFFSLFECFDSNLKHMHIVTDFLHSGDGSVGVLMISSIEKELYLG